MFLCIVVCICLHVCAQIRKPLNVPRDGDVLVGYQLYPARSEFEYTPICDFSQMEKESKKHIKQWISIGNDSDSLALVESNSVTTVVWQDHMLVQTGYEDNIEKIVYDKPIAYMPFINCSMEDTFHGTGIYCDKLRLQINGVYKYSIKEINRLVLPDNGDTIRHATLLYSQSLVSVHYNSVVARDTALFICDEYRWFVRGYRYPVIESRRLYVANEEPSDFVTFYYPLSEQNELLYDDGNMKERAAFCMADDADKLSDTDFTYHLKNDNVNKILTVDFENDTPVDVNVLIADVAGIVIKSASCNGLQSGSVSIPYGMLRGGQYLVYIQVGCERYVVKFNVE